MDFLMKNIRGNVCIKTKNYFQYKGNVIPYYGEKIPLRAN